MAESMFALAGWVIAAFWSAMWLGERGRRKDLAMLTALQVDRPPAAVVNQKQPEEKAQELISEEGMERLVNDIVEQSGADPKAARAEAERMLAEVTRLGGNW